MEFNLGEDELMNLMDDEPSTPVNALPGLTSSNGVACLHWTTFHGHTITELAQAIMTDTTSYCLTEWLTAIHDIERHNDPKVNTTGLRMHLIARLNRRILTDTMAFTNPGESRAVMQLILKLEKDNIECGPLAAIQSHRLFQRMSKGSTAVHARTHFEHLSMTEEAPPIYPGPLRSLFKKEDSLDVKKKVHMFYILLLAGDEECMAGLFEILRMAAMKNPRPTLAEVKSAAVSAYKQKPFKGGLTAANNLKLPKAQKQPLTHACGLHKKRHTFDFLLWEVLELASAGQPVIHHFVKMMFHLYEGPSSSKNPDRVLSLVQATLCLMFANHPVSGGMGKSTPLVDTITSNQSMLQAFVELKQTEGVWRRLRSCHRKQRVDLSTLGLTKPVQSYTSLPLVAAWKETYMALLPPPKSIRHKRSLSNKPESTHKRAKLEHPLPVKRRATCGHSIKPPADIGEDTQVEAVTLIKKDFTAAVYMARITTVNNRSCARVVRPPGEADTVEIDQLKVRLDLPSGHAQKLDSLDGSQWLVSWNFGQGGSHAATAHTHIHCTSGLRYLDAIKSGAPSIDLVCEQEKNNPVFWSEVCTALLWRQVLGCGHNTASNLLWVSATQRVASVGETAACGGPYTYPAASSSTVHHADTMWTTLPCQTLLEGVREHMTENLEIELLQKWQKEILSSALVTNLSARFMALFHTVIRC